MSIHFIKTHIYIKRKIRNLRLMDRGPQPLPVCLVVLTVNSGFHLVSKNITAYMNFKQNSHL